MALALPALVRPAAAAPDCRDAPPTAFVERFVPADCARCWAADPRDAPPPRTLAIDWVVPAAADAPMAAAALREAAARAGPLAAGASAERGVALVARDAPRLRVAEGPPWNGYVGLSLTVTRTAPWRAGSRAFMALVEHVPAGSEGSAIERRLVRAVAGPLTLEP
ncbi:MAG TPA: hypothetical protein VFZ93_10275, partial [Albitalea sp.]